MITHVLFALYIKKKKPNNKPALFLILEKLFLLHINSIQSWNSSQIFNIVLNVKQLFVFLNITFL